MNQKEETVSTEARRGIQWHGAAALLIGLVLFLAIRGGKILRPGYTDWLMAGDPATHWLGWQFFRHSPWLQWPLGANTAYGMEIGSSVVFTDSIPLLALIFKPFSGWLPDNFQYLGLWLLSCLCLQSFFAFKLLCRFTADKRLALVCSVFFTIAPPCLVRIVQGHFALVAHWLLLAGLWLYFAKQFSSRRWLALLLLTTLIHAYILVMVWAIWAADLLQRRLLRQASTRMVLTHLLVANVCIVLVMWAAGYFMLGSEVGLVGFGLYRLNLVTLFDPDVIWSLVLRNQPTGPGDYEGFAFMGLGMLLLAAVAGAELLRQRQVGLRPGLWP
ncbi:MAG: hypothetical protein JWP29_4930, partial [Rhodoferax sp.]|nr:hypothetical protein [Rhodoferax sp.]